MAVYERCVRDERQGKSYRAGGVDLFYSAYLPYCNEFVTHDPKQLQALQMVAHLADLPIRIRSFDEFRSGLIPDALAPSGGRTPDLRDSVLEYRDPFEPVASEDWEASR